MNELRGQDGFKPDQKRLKYPVLMSDIYDYFIRIIVGGTLAYFSFGSPFNNNNKKKDFQ